MAATSALDIIALLPQRNCGECGEPLCVTFAAQLRGGKRQVADCPHLGEEDIAKLIEALVPPVQGVVIGNGGRPLVVGEERVLYRHELRFFHPPALAILVDDDLSPEDQRAKIEKIKALDFSRMGEQLCVDMVAVRSRTGSADLLVEAVRRVRDGCDLPVALVTSDPVIARESLTALGGGPALLCFATKDNLEEMAAVARDFAAPLAVQAPMAELESLVERVQKLGVSSLLLAPVSSASASFSAGPNELTSLRRMAINEGRLGYPILVYPVGPLPEAQEITWAAALVAKYAGVVFLESAEPHAIYPLLVLRQSVYADPTVPATVQPGLYTEGSPDRNSPILLTGNFAMTYSMVSSDVRSAGVNAYVVVADGQGYSVGVACLLGAIASEQVSQLLDETGVRDKVDHHCLIIPGLMEPLKDKLQTATGMEILVGPIDSRHIARYLEDSWHPVSQAPQ